ncbi:LppP/LprE family lipoprotein, partial [Frankia nepalensis]|uniref:LppP/LprE family lipoprotein n=1 Tax=Frankia nepalensis TaxID=1836974 RepID=UPI001EE41E0D
GAGGAGGGRPTGPPTPGAAAAGAARAPTAASTATATAPAGGLSTAEAAAAVRARGYTPADTSGYDPDRALSVIVGMLATSADGHPQRAFFFHDGRFVGTDAAEPSATIGWIWSTDDTVALQYQLYRPSDPMCCPTAGAATVRFRWTGATVASLDPLPSTSWDAPASRR